jgi:cyanate lyase
MGMARRCQRDSPSLRVERTEHFLRRRNTMDRTAALEKIRSARVAGGVSYEELGKAIGTKDPTYIAAALHGQHRLNAEEAKRLAAAVGVDAETAMATTAMPLRTDFPLTTDPFKYRLMELVGVYGDALRERCNELFGDGILSAIDCVVKLEKKGERGVLTIDAKFLHYKEY